MFSLEEGIIREFFIEFLAFAAVRTHPAALQSGTEN
jgi:hypothetical protein